MRRAASQGYGLALLMVFFASTIIFAMTIQLMSNTSGMLSSAQGNTTSSSVSTVAFNAVRQDIINQLQSGSSITTSYRYPSSGTINVTTPKSPTSLTGQDPNNSTGLTDVIGSYYGTVVYAKNGMYLVQVTATVGGTTMVLTQPMFLKGSLPYPIDLMGNTNSYTGTVITTVGDVDKDGFDDFIVGAPGQPGTSATGEAYLIFGRSNTSWNALMPSNGEFQLKTANTSVNYNNRFIHFVGSAAHSQLGTSASAVGDVNKDGYPDFVITAPTDHNFDPTNNFASVTGSTPGPGEVFLVLGRSRTNWDTLTSKSLNFTLNSTNATAANQIYRVTESSTNRLGTSVAGLGDVDGDGYADFVVSADEDANLTYLIFGRSTANWSTLENTSLATTGTKANSVIRFKPASGGYFGMTAVCSLGDIDKDGYNDVGIGGMDNHSNYGSLFVVFGRAAGTWPAAWATNGDFPMSATNVTFANGFMEFEGRSATAGFAQSCGGGSDVDGDGYSDFIIGVPDGGGSNYYGEAYLLLGRNRTGTGSWNTLTGGSIPFQLTSGNTSWANKVVRFYGNTLYMNVGSSINMLGDVNKDGFSDILIGAWDGGTGNDDGEVHLINGRSTANWGSLIPSNGDFILGTSNASWTRANGFIRFIGRNYSDQIAGPDYENGHQIAPLGDINGDGIADFAMGDPHATSLAGAAYVFFGRSNVGWNALFTTRDVNLKTLFP